MEYYPRLITPKVEKWMKKRYIVLLKGARQVGKTTLLKMLQKKHGGSYIDLTDDVWRERFEKDPLSFLELETPLFLDEIGMARNAGKLLKLIYDKKKIPVVVSGSGAFEVKENITGYLVGRAISFTLYPLSFEEYVMWKNKELYSWYKKIKKQIWEFIEGKTKDFPKIEEIEALKTHYKTYVRFGGYPAVVLSNEEKRTLLKSIVEAQLEKDIFQFFDIREKEKFKDYIKYLAINVGNLFNAQSTGLSNITAWKYANILEMEYIVRLLSPFYKNLSTELRKSKKIYFYDTGVARFLSEERLSLGQENENFLFTQLVQRYEKEKLRYWRTQGGAEVDFVVVEKGKPAIAIEVKTGERKSRSLLSLASSYKLKKAILISSKTRLERRGSFHLLHLSPWWV